MPFTVSSPYTCYAKITAKYSAPYASHKLFLGQHGYDAYGEWWAGGVDTPWSTSVSDRTPLTTCDTLNNHWAVSVQQLGGGSPGRLYTISLFSGTY